MRNLFTLNSSAVLFLTSLSAVYLTMEKENSPATPPEGKTPPPPLPTPAVPPPDYNLQAVYSPFVTADIAGRELRERVDRQTRNTVRMTHRMNSLEDQMLDVERDRIVG